MSVNNDVFQVLVTKGNQAVLPAGGKVDTLGVGQIGVFDANTNLSFTAGATVKDFFIAVGVDKTGGSVTNSINTSAGQLIQKKNIRAYSFRPHTAARPQVTELTDFTSSCDTDYSVKIEFRNQEVYRRQGYNQFTKLYSVRTACCDGCETCPTGDCNELAKLLIENINSDSSGLILAEAIDGPGGAVVADIDAFIATNAAVNSDADKTNDVCLSIRLTTIPSAVESYCSINTRYFKPRDTVVIVSLAGGFDCTGKITVTQEAAFEEGSGYDVMQREYKAGGYNGKPGPYRADATTGLATTGFKYFAEAGIQYDKIALTYDMFSVSGWQEHFNNLATEIAVPAVDIITRDALVAVLDSIVTPFGYDALADDAASASVDPTVVETTSGQDDPALDGIG